MTELTMKVRDVERQIAAERGPLNFFALFERDDLADRWDLVVSAPWARHDEETLRFLANALRERLTPAEMTLLARVVVLDAAEHPIKAMTETYAVEHGQVELHDPETFGLPVRHGYIITSRRAA